ncbi:hypothetical protein TNCV_3378561 [Trichonephila clavipes]|nr:hypothetical protein TNCV_3378561 [Trichonephila clavipes]
MNDLGLDLFLKLYAWFSGLCFEFESFCLYYLKADTEKNQFLNSLSQRSPSEELLSERRIMETIEFEFNHAEKIKKRILERQKDVIYFIHDESYLSADMSWLAGNDLPHIPPVIRTLTLKMETLEDFVKDFKECFLKIRKLLSDLSDKTQRKQEGL